MQADFLIVLQHFFTSKLYNRKHMYIHVYVSTNYRGYNHGRAPTGFTLSLCDAYTVRKFTGTTVCAEFYIVVAK